MKVCCSVQTPPNLLLSLDQKSDRRIFVECVMALFGGFIHFWANSQKPKVLSLIQHFLGKSSEILFCFSPIVLVLNTCILQCMNDRLRNQWATFIFRRRPFKMCFLYIFCILYLRVCGNFLYFFDLRVCSKLLYFVFAYLWQLFVFCICVFVATICILYLRICGNFLYFLFACLWQLFCVNLRPLKMGFLGIFCNFLPWGWFPAVGCSRD